MLMKRWATLPRDSRDTLFLLLAVAWAIAPQVAHLPAWATALAGLMLLWRARVAWTSAPLPSRWWLLLLLAGTVAATFLTYRTIAGREAGVTLVTMLLALKTLELRARRDAMVVFFLGFFAMLTNFLFSQSLLVAGAMVVALAGLLTALVQAHMTVGRPSLAEAGRIALRLMLFGAPVMAALFLFFPRIAPLWGAPGDSAAGRSGLSADMQVGSIASLALDDSVAMRIRFLDTPSGNAPPQQQLYFRGPVLASFDGRQWRPLSERIFNEYLPRYQPPAVLRVNGPAVHYEATLEPTGHPWLLVMDAATDKPEGVQASLTPDLLWVSPRPMNQLVRYRAASYPDFQQGPLAPTRALRQFTALPPGFDPRTHALADQLRADPRYAAGGTPALVEAVLQRLRTGGYEYTLEPGVYGHDTADEFWFDRKQGFCEHIASAFVILMRAMDVPARIVTGYQGGDRNPVDGLWTVRQSDAHAWAEVWEAGRGWVRVDPTGAVAPGRIGQQQRLLAPQNAFAAAFGTVVGRNFGEHLRAAWEAVNNRWNQWVLNYTQGEQLNLLRRLGFDAPDWQSTTQVLAALAVAAMLGAAGWNLYLHRTRDPWLRLLGQARRRLVRQGLDAGAAVPPRTLAAQVEQCFGPPGAALHGWLLRMEAQRYAPGDEASRRLALSVLRREFRQLSWPSPLPPPPATPAGTPPFPEPTA